MTHTSETISPPSLVITFPPNPPLIFFLKKPVKEIVVNSAKNENASIVYKTSLDK